MPELLHVNQAFNLLAIVVYDIENVLKPFRNHSHAQFEITEIIRKQCRL